MGWWLTFRGAAADDADMPTRRRTLTFLAAISLFAIVLSACSADATRGPDNAAGAGAGAGGSDPAQSPDSDGTAVSDPVALIRGVTKAMEEEETYRATFEFTVQGQGQSFSASGEGEFSDDPVRAHVDYRFEGFPGLKKGLAMEMILDGSTMYMRSPLLRRSMGIPTEWISMNLDELVPGFSELAQLSQGQNDPTSSLTYLEGITDAEELGSDVVAGVDTTHYRGSVNLDEAYDQLPSDAGAALEETIAQAKRLFGDEPMPIDVWIDADGLLRRMTVSLQTDARAKVAFGMTMTMEIPEYGVVIDLPIPAAHDVTDLGRFADNASGW
jgi:hypothetical protein